MNKNIDSWIESNRDFIINLREWLHQHPEIGFQEHKTSAHLKSILKEGTDNAKRLSNQTLSRVKQALGFLESTNF